MAFAFVGVQMAVFGVYMGASFAPNHKGMALIPSDARLDFLSKQVLTSRNIRGGWFMNMSYEWGCTTGVAAEPGGQGMRLLRTLDWPFHGMGREVVVAVTNGRLDFGTWERIF